MDLKRLGGWLGVVSLVGMVCLPAARSHVGAMPREAHTGADAHVEPVTSHPRLWLRAADLPRLRSWAVEHNPIYRDGLAPLADQAKAAMDADHVPGADTGSTSYDEFPTEAYAELFAFMSLISNDQRVRHDYARRARTLLMYAIREAARGPADGKPFRDPRFATSDRSRWWGEAFPLTVDWIYPSLSSGDKTSIRSVFLRWASEDLRADTTTDNHPEPLGLVNNPVLIRDRIRVRYAANNYYNAHMRNIGLMAMAFDQADDPGHTLWKYLENATGAWLYTVDYLLRHDARGGLAPEGFEYGPHSLGYAAQFLLALHTAGLDNPTLRGAQVVLGGNPFWADLVPAYLHSLSPAPVPYTDGAYRYLGPVYEPAWYGDAQQYWAPDNMELFGPLGLYDDAIGSSRQLAAIRWIQTNMAPGGAAHLTERVRRASYPRDALFYFLLFDPHIAAPADPRPDLPLTFFAPGVGHILARTSWRPDAAWFDYSLGWNSIDHQHADGNSFEFYRRGEWLTKQRTGYSSLTADSTIGSSQAQNTLTLQNDPPAHDAPDDYRHGVGQVGSQWPYGLASGDGQILAHSFGRGYVYALGDATALYNSSSEGATDITNASRSIVWLRPDYIVIYDRAVSRTAGRFKRFWLQLPTQATIRGNRATMTTPKGQHLFITNLLPGGARITSAPAQAARSEPAVGEPMHFVLRVEAPRGSQDVRFLHVLQGADAGTTAARVSLVLSTGGTPFAGALVDNTLILFPARLGGAVMGITYSVPTDTRTQLITGLTPNGGYDVTEHSLRGTMQVTIRTGTAYRADSGGVLTWGAPTQQGRVSLAQVPSAIPPAPRSATATDGTSHTPPAAAVATRTPSVTPVSTPASSGGHITYSMANGHVYRLAARTGAQPQDISLTLNRLNPSARDMFLNSAPDGTWLVLATGRGDPSCAVWACLAVVRGGGSSVDLVRVMGRVIHPSAFSAIASGGKLIVWPNSGDRPREDLWAIVRDGPAWRAPVRITGHSPYTYNDQPAIAIDGSKVVFDCGDRPYAAEGTAICEVGTNGTGFRVVLTPTGSPPGFPHTGALHHPAYGGDGSIIFEASWGSEQIWQLPALGRRPIQVAPQFGNDNSPCVLPDGRIVSLWLDRPGNSGAHEIKVMTPDGRDYAMVLPDVDVADIGVGCGR